jgi:penicillin-binding protein 2
MFERRLKIFLGFLIAVTFVLLARAAHLQLAHGNYWRKQAGETLRRHTLVEPVRGKIVDRNNITLAQDVACIDAAVDYRAIVLDTKWIEAQANSRLIARHGLAYRRAEKEARKKMLGDEIAAVNADIANMWKTLAQVAGQNLEDIEEVKVNIRRRVEMRRRYLAYARYHKAVKKEGEKADTPWYKDWRLGGKSNPELDNFNLDVSEETEAHVIVQNIKPEIHNNLKKRLEQFPGLAMRPGKTRHYPFGESACHIIGHLTPVDLKDLANDPNDKNELLEYLPNDRIGRSGVEAICELTLRGQRGRLTRLIGQDQVNSEIESQQGKTVKLTIDIQLQRDIEDAFKRVVWRENHPGTNQQVIVEAHEMHGAAVVIDIATGEVRALVSYPTYDLNRFADLYAMLAKDEINKPLMNRATQARYEPGSTVKTIVAAGALTAGIVAEDTCIECTGYLVIDGRQQSHGRCWTASNYAKTHPGEVAHHRIPSQDPHPTGHLNVVDAIQRSCNIYFETLGDRLRLDGLSYWYSQFGLGESTGIGLPEHAGRLPDKYNGPQSLSRGVSWFASIGQGQVWATPIQMANVSATIGRNGVWVRPRIVVDTSDIARPTTQPIKPLGPDRRVLPLNPKALAAVQEGMYRSVNTRAGSGYEVSREGLAICGKTGTATAARFSIPIRDEKGKHLKDERGDLLYYLPPFSTRESPNPALPWYRGKTGERPHHAWFIGYAPRENPKVAFAIMLEYGGTGGHDAAPISRAVLDACINHGYLP